MQLTRLVVRTCAVVAAGMIPAVLPLAAQQSSPAAFEPGRRAIEVQVPDGASSSIAIWWVRSPERQVGLNTSFSVTSDRAADGERRTSWGFGIGPTFLRQLASVGPLVPHWRLGASVGAGGSSSPSSPRTVSLAGRGGVGVEWFPVDRVSIGANVGAGVNFSRQSADPPGATGRISSSRISLSSGTSALSMKLYF